MQPNKAIVGRNAFAHESGIHQDGVLKERSTYEIMDADHGRAWTTQLSSCWASTPAATRCARRWRSWAISVDGQALNTAFKRFKELADKKKQVTAMDLEALVTDELREERARLHARVVRRRGLLAPPAARDGRRAHARAATRSQGSFTGDGPIDAVFRAINAATGLDARLREFRVDAVTGGQDALGEVSVVVELGANAGERVGLPGVLLRERATGAGQAVTTDIIEAAGIAYARALTNAVRRIQDQAAEDIEPAPELADAVIDAASAGRRRGGARAGPERDRRRAAVLERLAALADGARPATPTCTSTTSRRCARIPTTRARRRRAASCGA